ncbi:MAG: DNA cytosine methyltransferase [Candidatus Kapaibacteriota bacterium]
MTHIDLFSGIGGFALAARWAWGDEYENVGHSEIDIYAEKVYHKWFPTSPCLGDIQGIKWEEGQCDLLTGGFPCQDFSIAGRRMGLAGNRSGLFWKLAEHIERIKPRWFVLENVPGLLSSRNGKDIHIIISALDKIGYCVAWRVLDAQYFGVAQRRKRVWIVGSLGNTSAVKVLFEREGSTWNDSKKQKMGERGLCLNTRSGERYDPTAETYVATTIGATIRGNTKYLWQDTYIAQTNIEREREVDGIPRRLDGVRGRLLGNAIVPQVAEAIFQRIKRSENGVKTERSNNRDGNADTTARLPSTIAETMRR